MLTVVFLLSLACAFAKENFRADSGILGHCFAAGLCTVSTGCCNGHGTCHNTTTGVLQCVCDSIQQCNGNYTGTTCNTPPSTCPTAPSNTNPAVAGTTQDQFWAGIMHLPGGDPDRGNYGNLLVREGSALYADGLGTPKLWTVNASNLVADATSLGNTVRNSMSGSTTTAGSMMGLGLLEFALKDIVDFEYNYNINVTLGNNTYPTLKWQNNTGINATWNGTTYSIPKQFANNATGFIDLGPLYDWSNRITQNNFTLPYLDISAALAHWSNNSQGLGHHMSHEFLVALQFYAQYHYYAVRNMEEYFCGQNTTISGGSTLYTNCQQLPVNGQKGADWIFNQSRRSAIRFSQAILQQAVLQITLEHVNSDGTHMDGFYDAIFEFWFRRETNLFNGAGPEGSNGPAVRQHQEWNGDVTRTSFTHHAISGLDFLISLRNPNYDTTATSLLSHASNCHPGIVLPSIANDVMSLLHTPLQRYGSKPASQYLPDLYLQHYRASELGLPSYKTHIGGLTNQTTTGVNDLTQDYHVFYYSQLESNSSRQYKSRIASVALASIVPVSDVTIIDQTSYWHVDSSDVWTAFLFHPDQTYIPIPAYDFSYCATDPVTSTCTTTSQNAGAVVLGYHPDMGILRGDPSLLQQENNAYYRSNGVTFPTPDVNGIFPSSSSNWQAPDFSQRQTILWRIIPEFANTIFYQYDGLNTLAVKQAGSDVRYLANQLIDSIPVDLAFMDINYDYNSCFQASLITGADGCTRVDSSVYDNNDCFWFFPNLQE